jgi:hypothetical protein
MLRHEIDAMNAKHSEELEKERVETKRLKGAVDEVKEERDGGRNQVRTEERNESKNESVGGIGAVTCKKTIL